jgi:hypothetical protein
MKLKMPSLNSMNTKTKVVHCKKEPYDVYIGRPSKWGNPYTYKRGTGARFIVPSREEAVAAFKHWILRQPKLLKALPELKGKTLGCWCSPYACHGDVLAELADKCEE